MKWFSYDPEDGCHGDFRFHETEAEAKATAQRHLNFYGNYASSNGWCEDTENVCWGRVHERAKYVNIRPAPKYSQGEGGIVRDCELRPAE